MTRARLHRRPDDLPRPYRFCNGCGLIEQEDPKSEWWTFVIYREGSWGGRKAEFVLCDPCLGDEAARFAEWATQVEQWENK